MNLFKTTLLSIFSFLLIGNGSAQSFSKQEKKSRMKTQTNNNRLLLNDYSFSLINGTYADLDSATSVNNNQLWDDPSYIVPIGFNFQFYDKMITDVYFGIGLGGLLTDTFDLNFGANYVMPAFETDLIDRGDIIGISKSPISYKVDGTVGTRIFKLEFKNAGFYDEEDSLSTLNDSVSFQFWLYEGTNDIEFHYGPSALTYPLINYFGETGALIGLTDFNITNAYLLSGPLLDWCTH